MRYFGIFFSTFFTASAFVFSYFFSRFASDGWLFVMCLSSFLFSFVCGVGVARLLFGEEWAIFKKDNAELIKENKKLLKKTTKQEFQIAELQEINSKLRLKREELAKLCAASTEIEITQ